MQFFLINEFLNRIADSWLSTSVLTQALPVSMSQRNRLEYVFLPRGWDWVDPAKDSKAHSQSIANRTRSRSAIIRAAGDDPEEVFNEIAEEETLMRSKGIDPTPPQENNTNVADDEEKTAAGAEDD